jgi:hypothetical protein
MFKVPFAEQILPTDFVLRAQTDIKAGKSVSGDDLLLAIEQTIQQPLPEVLRSVIRQATISAVKMRGRPSKFGALLDLALEKVDQRYPALLRYEKRKKDRFLRSGKVALKGDSSSMFAYGRLLQHMKDDFGPMTWEALRNMHSQWRNGHFHPAENHADSRDFSAEINRLFPGPQDS